MGNFNTHADGALSRRDGAAAYACAKPGLSASETRVGATMGTIAPGFAFGSTPGYLKVSARFRSSSSPGSLGLRGLPG